MNNSLIDNGAKLVPYSEMHFNKTVEWLNNQEIREMFGITKKVNLKTHCEWVNSLKNTKIWAIYDQENNHYCGNILLFCNPSHRSAFIQIYIGEPRSKGRGIGFSSMNAVLRYGFEKMKINRIWLKVFSDNERAICLYEKLGFSLEGYERESHFNGRTFKDQLIYSILYREWKTRKRG